MGTAFLLTILLGSFVGSAWADTPAEEPDAAAFEMDFLSNMIDHHSMAVGMAAMCLEKAVHAELRALCGRIVESQSAEIESMQSWLAEWYGIDHEPIGNGADMDHLQMLSGAAFEVDFLRMMSEHHSMAVREGLECLRPAEHGEVRGLCRDIVRTQIAEIVRMQIWLCRWYADCRFDVSLAA